MDHSPGLRKGAAALALLLALLLAACGGEPPPFEVVVGVSPTPATVGRARVLVQVSDREGRPVGDARVTVQPVGPDGAAGEAVAAEASPGGPYVAPEVALPRPGAWTLRVVVRGPGGAVVEREWPLHVVGPGPGPGSSRP